MSAAFDRVSDIKVVPSLWRWGRGRRGGARKRKKRFEVGEIFLEDVCICVDAGVWNDLLGDQVGAAFSPEFRLSVNVGPKVRPSGAGVSSGRGGGQGAGEHSFYGLFRLFCAGVHEVVWSALHVL